jgi:outer membrane protein OmpA-like peptidoglycan-associated protein
MGLEFRLFKDVFVVSEAKYRVATLGDINSHYYYSIGVAGVINKRSKRTTNVAIKQTITIIPGVSNDLDRDGIVDSADDCPTVAGMAIFSGCPDRDGDGIQDRCDSCIETPGFERYNGCPVPDTDKDGINDEQDSCVFVPGLPMYNGCPAPDFDSDSVTDEEDRCPSVAGDRENQGCPVVKDEIVKRIKTASAKVLFFTGSAKLTPSSSTPLNEILEILKADTFLMATIHGHTDNIGSTLSNQALSERRAKAVVDFLIEHGVSAGRLKFSGYGETLPISENNTVVGRRTNRRVEIQLRYPTKKH